MYQPKHRSHPVTPPAGASGVTLVELMVALGIATLLLTLGISGMSRLIADGQRATAANSLMANLNYARAQAIYRGTNVVVCPINPGGKKAKKLSGDACATGSKVRAADRDIQWHQSYIIFVEATGEWLRVESAVKGVRIDSPPTVTRFTFQSDGSLTNFGGQLRVCDQADTSATDEDRNPTAVAPRVIVIDAVGRVRSSDRSPDGDGDIDCSM